MFDHEWLERLACGHPALPLALYTPFGLALIVLAWVRGAGVGSLAAWYIIGMAVWSVFEYGMHRFSFHHTPASRTGLAFGYMMHGVHHAYPDDSRRWVMPMIVTVPVGLTILAIFWLLLGTAGLPAFAGFAHGYLAYDTVHYAIHRGPLPTSVGRFLRRHHMQHHYATPEARFGVSSPLWDVFFRTR
jgi:sterol desaturase/sphingolipid hydroxylase (fatty acid hydroxylase superfamily)